MDADYIDVSGICDGATPPKTVGLELEVIRITKPVFRHFVILSEKAWGAWFHWFGRSVRCFHPTDCERCKRSKKKWRAYLQAIEYLPNAKKSVIIELTLPAIQLIEVQLCLQPLRGTTLKLAKTEGGKHGRFRVEVLPRRVDPQTLPEQCKCADTMNKLWDLNEKWDGPTTVTE